ncbi:MAG: hypothetical protein KDA42_17395 [Planctomycetales bacterium]|nr:hypothetical protein [Planctomycetales bacterium]
MRATEDRWHYKVERGPDWLFVKVVPPSQDQGDTPHIDTDILNLLRRHTAHRVVLELDEVAALPPQFLEELVALREQLEQDRGVMRLTGLSAPCLEQFRANQLEGRLPTFPTRQEAVFGKAAAPSK